MMPELTRNDLSPVVSGYRLPAAIRAMADRGVRGAVADAAMAAEQSAALEVGDVGHLPSTDQQEAGSRASQCSAILNQRSCGSAISSPLAGVYRS